jgi:hypothetical protein
LVTLNAQAKKGGTPAYPPIYQFTNLLSQKLQFSDSSVYCHAPTLRTTHNVTRIT